MLLTSFLDSTLFNISAKNEARSLTFRATNEKLSAAKLCIYVGRLSDNNGNKLTNTVSISFIKYLHRNLNKYARHVNIHSSCSVSFVFNNSIS